MVEKPSLLDALCGESPGLEVDAFMMNRSPTVCFRLESQKVWIALDEHPRPKGIDEALGCVANMLVCCQNCQNGPEHTCYQDHSVVSGRLRKLLGPAGYELLLASAPIQSGSADE